MKAAMLREWQTVNHAGRSPQEVHCHQYLGILKLPNEKTSDAEKQLGEESA